MTNRRNQERTGQRDADEAEKLNQPTGAPIAPTTAAPVSRETLSHQWQENSAALNTNELAGYGNAETNVLQQVLAQDEEAEEPKQERLSKEEWTRRTKLDVSHKDYINPSLDHHEAR